jgi:hypothetical protein
LPWSAAAPSLPGGWRGGKITIEHLGRIEKKDAAALETDAAAVLEFLAN